MNERLKPVALFDGEIVWQAFLNAFKKLNPAQQIKNPVMFVVLVGSILTTVLYFQALIGQGEAPAGFILAVTGWLWFTVLFANFAEAIAEGRSRAQAASLRKAKQDIAARKLLAPRHDAEFSLISSTKLRQHDIVLVNAGEFIPGDGDVIEGVASVDESAITGESAPVIRESGGDFSAVTGGTRVLSDWLVIRITTNPGESFLDRMIAMVEGAKRQKTPNEIALTILLVALTIVFFAGDRDFTSFFLLQCRSRQVGTTRHTDGIDRFIGLPYSNYHRRLAVSHRCGGHGQNDAEKRDCDIRARS